MPTASQVKKGLIITVNKQPHVIETVSCQSPSARGGNTLYKIRARNVITNQKSDLSCKGDEMFKEADYQKKAVQYMYCAQELYCFMDLEDYSQFELASETLTDEAKFLTEDMELTALVTDGIVRTVQLPDTVNLTVTECDPGIKGASATARTKNAVVETGYSLQVPEYLESGEIIKIDTRTGKYLSRA